MAATEISVDHIARVEGHGDIRLVIEDGQVTTCEMAVVEPARLFESMCAAPLRGGSLHRLPRLRHLLVDHVVTDLRAIEQVFGVEVTDRTEALARASALRLLPAEPRHAPVRVRRPGLLGSQVGVPAGRGQPGAVRARAGAEGAGQRAVHAGGRPVHSPHHGRSWAASPTRSPPTSTSVWPRPWTPRVSSP